MSIAEPYLTELHVLGQALVAIFLGGIIGWERERAARWAGFRTHMLVCLATSLFINVGQILARDSREELGVELLRADPGRLIEAVVTGIAFIGAGTVFRDRDGKMAYGLTTAASLFTVGAIGIAVAVEQYLIAAGTTLLVFVILRVLGRLESRLFSGRKEQPGPNP